MVMEVYRGLQHPAGHLPHPGQGSIKTTSMPNKTYLSPCLHSMGMDRSELRDCRLTGLSRCLMGSPISWGSSSISASPALLVSVLYIDGSRMKVFSLWIDQELSWGWGLS